MGLDAGGVRMSKTQSLPSKSRGRNIHLLSDIYSNIHMLTHTNRPTYTPIHIYSHTYSLLIHKHTQHPYTFTYSHTFTYKHIYTYTHTYIWELTKWRPWVEYVSKLQREGERNNSGNNPVRQLLQKLSTAKEIVIVELLNAKELVYQDLDSSSDPPLLSLRSWLCYLYLMLSLFSSLLLGSYHRTYLKGFIWGLNEMIHVNHLAQCLACSKHSIHIQFLIFNDILIIISEG